MRALFGYRLEIGLGVTAIAAPFVRPTLAKKPSELALKAIGLCLVLAGLSVRAWAAGFAGRHTRSSEIEGNKLAMAGPYLRSCSQSHLPWERHSWVWNGTPYWRPPSFGALLSYVCSTLFRANTSGGGVSQREIFDRIPSVPTACSSTASTTQGLGAGGYRQDTF